jgi:hypothetical protein
MVTACGHRIEPDPAEMAERYGAKTTISEWRERLVCSACGSRDVDMVVTGTERRQCNEGRLTPSIKTEQTEP